MRKPLAAPGLVMALVKNVLPRGFDLIREGRRRFVVRSEFRTAVVSLLRRWSEGRLPAGRPLVGGRGGVAAYDLGGNVTAVLRPCLRGGLVGRFNRELYLGCKPRPFDEVRVAEFLKERGVSTVEILGAGVAWLGPACYRGAVVSREAEGAASLWEYLNSVQPAERVAICAAAARVAREFHAAGAVHPDLNLRNFLVVTGRGAPQVLVIDCDRVRLRRVVERDRKAAFARICRSIRRLDPTSAVITLGCVEALRTIEMPESSVSGRDVC